MTERVMQTCCGCCAPTFHPYVQVYVVTCNIFVLYCSWQSYLRTYLLKSFVSHDNAPNSISAGAPTQTPLGELTALPQTPLAGFKGVYTSLPICLLLTDVALCQRVRGMIAMTRYINVLTYLLTSVVL